MPPSPAPQWVAVCTQCSWRSPATTQEAVADAMERHARKERHHVDIHRVATA